MARRLVFDPNVPDDLAAALDYYELISMNSLIVFVAKWTADWTTWLNVRNCFPSMSHRFTSQRSVDFRTSSSLSKRRSPSRYSRLPTEHQVLRNGGGGIQPKVEDENVERSRRSARLFFVEPQYKEAIARTSQQREGLVQRVVSPEGTSENSPVG